MNSLRRRKTTSSQLILLIQRTPLIPEPLVPLTNPRLINRLDPEARSPRPTRLPTRPIANADDYLGGLHVGETRKQAQFVPIERVNNKHELCQRGVIASTASAIKLLSGKDTKTRKGYRIVYGTHLFRHADNTDVCDRYHTMFSKRHATRLQREKTLRKAAQAWT